MLSIFEVLSFYCHSKFLAQIHFLRLLSTELFHNLLNRLWVEVYLFYNFFIKAFGTRLISFIVTLPFSINFHCLFLSRIRLSLWWSRHWSRFRISDAAYLGSFSSQTKPYCLLPSGCNPLIKFFGRQLSQSCNSQFH